MPKFKPGDIIEVRPYCQGFEKATVIKTFVSTQDRFKDQQMYLLKIMNGKATIPVSAEVNYRLFKHS